ncbi:MAG: phosphonoacetaldehyde hydrolase [Geminicoccaceae bacterium]|jgi:phosphonoacetaldehyde hydrolase|nr:phosphonoacetaldehyde hydrolase [Geminicoccaceae bacterium]MCB9966499.1 phosphonoacetaldehyde hydrolase [Geminicoccaceae bacterium]HRY24999.1 phosphonoacetaldehyde hydrolase [Geminicoccaceae bacterium]
MYAYRWQRRYVGPVRAVIFDMAGTLMDFGSRAPAGVFVEVFRRRRVAMTVAEARGPMGAEKRRHIEMLLELPAVAERFAAAHGRAWSQQDVDELYAAFIPLQIESLPAFAGLVPGALDVGQALAERGIGIGVNSGYSRDMLEVCLAEAKRQGFAWQSAVAASDVPRARPCPAMCLKNAAELAVADVAACVKVDDTVPGILEGLAAGMWTVGLAISGNEVGLSHADWQALRPAEQEKRRERAVARLAEAGAHYVVDSVADLLPCIAAIEKRLGRGERP